jgi:hypothetical protein
MPYKFLRGDTVRRIGTEEDLIVAQADDDGTRYLLTHNSNSVAPQTSASEDELELVKRASDSFTGLKPNLYVT